MLKKGFIGPIGDDLPSLIPLLFGLVIFFSTFTVTFNAFDQRNAEFNNDVAVMRISRTLQSSSYISSYENFSGLCRQIGVVNLKYVAGISEDAANGRDVSSIFDVSFFSKGGKTFYCSNITESSPEKISDFLSLKESVDTKVVSRIFPIVVEDDKIVKPMHLFVVAWK